MLKRMRKNKKGFTLAELLIVVAIIGVLVAISIPIFTAQLNKSKQAADVANARSIYAEVTADYLDDSTIDNAPDGTVTKGGTIKVGSDTFKFSDICTEFKYTAPSATVDHPTISITTNGKKFEFPGNVDGTAANPNP